MKIDSASLAGRIYTIMTAVTGAGLVAAWLLAGASGTFGFALGAAISFGNAWWMHRIASSIGTEGRKPVLAAIFAVLRYLVMLAGLYVILDFSESGFYAALAGCFVHIVAVVLGSRLRTHVWDIMSSGLQSY